MLVNADSGVQAIAPIGGFDSQLPENQARPSWTYKFYGGQPVSSLTTKSGLRWRHMQIDSYGDNAADAVTLSAAIDAVLHDYRGTLSDPNSTVVDHVSLVEEPMDFFDDAARSYRRMTEYEVWFVH